MTGTSPPAAGTVVVWITEGTWRSCVDAARDLAPPAARTVLLHVTPEEVPGAVQGAYAGLLGRHAPHDPGREVARAAAASATELLAAAAGRLGRPCDQMERRGRTEREVVAAAVDADLLILARDGDRSRLGPKSLGPATRFAVDHAPCPVLLVWPGPPPAPATIPPPPGRRRPGRHPAGGPPHPAGGPPHPPGGPPHPPGEPPHRPAGLRVPARIPRTGRPAAQISRASSVSSSTSSSSSNSELSARR